MKYSNNLYSHLDKLKLDLGSGISPKEGFIGIDNFTGIKSQSINPNSINLSELSVIRHDLKEGIPFESDSVDEIRGSHFLEHCAFLPELL